jgi:hypothetical protein
VPRRRGLALEAGARHHDGELITTGSRHHEIGETAGQAGRNLDEDAVADLVAEAVVDHLEVVDVNQEECAGLVLSGKDGVEMLGERGTNRETGEGIVPREEQRLLFGAITFADVSHHGQDTNEVTARVPAGRVEGLIEAAPVLDCGSDFLAAERSVDERGPDTIADNSVQTTPDEALYRATLVQAAGAIDEAALEIERGNQHGDGREHGVEQGPIVRTGSLGGHLDRDVCRNCDDASDVPFTTTEWGMDCRVRLASVLCAPRGLLPAEGGFERAEGGPIIGDLADVAPEEVADATASLCDPATGEKGEAEIAIEGGHRDLGRGQRRLENHLAVPRRVLCGPLGAQLLYQDQQLAHAAVLIAHGAHSVEHGHAVAVLARKFALHDIRVDLAAQEAIRGSPVPRPAVPEEPVSIATQQLLARVAHQVAEDLVDRGDAESRNLHGQLTDRGTLEHALIATHVLEECALGGLGTTALSHILDEHEAAGEPIIPDLTVDAADPTPDDAPVGSLDAPILFASGRNGDRPELRVGAVSGRGRRYSSSVAPRPRRSSWVRPKNWQAAVFTWTKRWFPSRTTRAREDSLNGSTRWGLRLRNTPAS